MKKKSPKSQKKNLKMSVIKDPSLAKAIHQQAMELWRPDTPSSMERLIRGLGSTKDRDV